MDYQKYLKYKTKYLQLKAKLTQLGGGAKCYHDRKHAGGNETLLRIEPIDNKNYVSPRIILRNGDNVELIETKNDFGKVKTVDGKEGWVRMDYLFNKDANGNERKCILFPPKGTLPPSGHAAMPSSAMPTSGTAASSSQYKVLVPGTTPGAPPVVAMKLPPAGHATAMPPPGVHAAAMPPPGVHAAAMPYQLSWGCDHTACKNVSGQVSAVAIILRNSSGQILVSTETNPSVDGYHLCAGKIDSGSCPVISCYDETAEEGRLLPVVNSGVRDFTRWDKMFKPGGNYIIQPWVSSTGKALVFVGDAGSEYWDALNQPYGTVRTFTNPNQLTTTFTNLRSNNSIDHKYREKIDFKWVTPLSKGRMDKEWADWGKSNNIYSWAKNLIREYVEKM
jgi:hypothetical protein